MAVQALLKVYPNAELSHQDFAIMMERMAIMKTGILSGCRVDYIATTPTAVGINAGWVTVKGRLVKVGQGSLGFTPLYTSGATPTRIYVYVVVNLATGTATVHADDQYDPEDYDEEDFNYSGVGMAACVIATFMNNDVSGTIEQETYKKVGSTQEVTLSASGWNATNKTYTITSTLITSDSYQRIVPGIDITEDKLKALQAANIQDAGQTNGSLTIKAYGTIPTVDIPIRVIYLGG
jgi:hypothetical protein